MKYKFLEHTADIKFRAFGKTIGEVFENSALALKETISKDKVGEKKKEKISLQIEGGDIENVLHQFLEEFLFLFDTKGFLLSKIKKMEIKEKSGAYFIRCEMTGDKAKNYEIANHVKAITYNEMFIKKQKDRWVSQVVLDV
jgi:SHS2 domain-containing protein